MRRVSKKRAAENRKRRRVVLERFGQHPRCAACGPLRAIGVVTGCNGLADDAHEPGMRSRGASIIDPDQCIPVGRICHSWIDDNVELATRAGLLIPSKPVSQPLRVRDPWTGQMGAPRSLP